MDMNTAADNFDAVIASHGSDAGDESGISGSSDSEYTGD
jgi:hypothetical protein